MKIKPHKPKILILGIIIAIAGELVYFKTHIDRTIAIGIAQTGAILIGYSLRANPPVV